MILLDTNLLARMTNSAHPQCAASRRAVHTLLSQRERLYIVPQNLYEFWAVATRNPGSPPKGQNGLGMSCERAGQWLSFFQRRFTLLPDRPELPNSWQGLVTTLGVKGFKSHDARLAAAMQTYGIQRLLTFNANDFKRFSIAIIDPATF
jgi:predicted nucleic acid-binding protein